MFVKELDLFDAPVTSRSRSVASLWPLMVSVHLLYLPLWKQSHCNPSLGKKLWQWVRGRWLTARLDKEGDFFYKHVVRFTQIQGLIKMPFCILRGGSLFQNVIRWDVRVSQFEHDVTLARFEIALNLLWKGWCHRSDVRLSITSDPPENKFFQTRHVLSTSRLLLFLEHMSGRLERDMLPPSGLEERSFLLTAVGLVPSALQNLVSTAHTAGTEHGVHALWHMGYLLRSYSVSDLIRFSGQQWGCAVQYYEGIKAHKPADSRVKVWPSSYRRSEHEWTQAGVTNQLSMKVCTEVWSW